MNEINLVRLYIAFRLIIIIFEYLFWLTSPFLFPTLLLSLLNLFCFAWRIHTTFVDRVWIHDTWRIDLKKKTWKYCKLQVGIFEHIFPLSLMFNCIFIYILVHSFSYTLVGCTQNGT